MRCLPLKRWVRSQTLGDTVGCADCLEPAPGVLNEAMFRHIDSVIASAARHHIRLIIPLTGGWCVLPNRRLSIKHGHQQ